MQVRAGRSVVRVPAGPDLWPETARETVIFAMGALTELEQHGADVAARQKVDVVAAAGRCRPISRRCPSR